MPRTHGIMARHRTTFGLLIGLALCSQAPRTGAAAAATAETPADGMAGSPVALDGARAMHDTSLLVMGFLRSAQSAPMAGASSPSSDPSLLRSEEDSLARDVVARSLRALHIPVRTPALLPEQLRCNQTECAKQLATAQGATQLIGGRVTETNRDSVAEVWVYDVAKNELRTNQRTCDHCTPDEVRHELSALATGILTRLFPECPNAYPFWRGFGIGAMAGGSLGGALGELNTESLQKTVTNHSGTDTGMLFYFRIINITTMAVGATGALAYSFYPRRTTFSSATACRPGKPRHWTFWRGFSTGIASSLVTSSLINMALIGYHNNSGRIQTNYAPLNATSGTALAVSSIGFSLALTLPIP